MCSMKERVIWMSCTCESGEVTLVDGEAEGSRFWKNAHLHNEQALAMAVQWQCNVLHSTMAKTVHLLNENLPS